MAITAKLNHFRMSPRKVRLVADVIRGMDIEDAQVHLDRIAKRAALPLKKLLLSAVASAEHNFEKKKSYLYIQAITVDCGPVLKRFRARAFGRAADIRKRTSHVTMVLGERTEEKAKKRFTLHETHRTKKPAEGTLEELSKSESKSSEGEVMRKKDGNSGVKGMRKEKKTGVQKRITDMGRKFFQRKSV